VPLTGSAVVRSQLVRGMLAGLAAGVAAFVFAYLFGEPGVNGGIAFEERVRMRIPTKSPGYNGMMSPGIPE